MSELKLTNENGKTTTLTFKFDNGLPTKPIITPNYSISFSEKNNAHALCMYFSNDELKDLDDLDIKEVYFSKNELWLTINDNYVVFGNLNDKIISEIKNKKLIYYFFRNEDDSFLKGTKIN